MADVVLRELLDEDLDAVFEQMRDPEAVWMAAFTSRDPNDRSAFDAHMKRIRANPEIVNRAILRDGVLVGTLGSWVMDGERELTYWIDRSVWGQGVASEALRQFLEVVPARPMYARAASDNRGSLRVLEKAGFRVTGTAIGYANARSGEIEETLLQLD